MWAGSGNGRSVRRRWAGVATAGIWIVPIVGTIAGVLAEVDPRILVGTLGTAAFVGYSLLGRKPASAHPDPKAFDLAQAAQVQRSLLPRIAAGTDALESAWCYRPAGEVGGDLLDISFLRDGLTLLVIADVFGHGIQAALVAAVVKALLHAYLDRVADLGPGMLLARLNGHVEALFGERFVTAAVCLLDIETGGMRYAVAGHPPILIIDHTGVAELSRGGLPLGVDGNSTFEEGWVLIRPGAVILLYTDGVIEAARGDGRRFGLPLLTKVLGTSNATDAIGVVGSIVCSVDEFRGPAPLADDFTILATRYMGATQPLTSDLDGGNSVQSRAGIIPPASCCAGRTGLRVGPSQDERR